MTQRSPLYIGKVFTNLFQRQVSWHRRGSHDTAFPIIHWQSITNLFQRQVSWHRRGSHDAAFPIIHRQSITNLFQWQVSRHRRGSHDTAFPIIHWYIGKVLQTSFNGRYHGTDVAVMSSVPHYTLTTYYSLFQWQVSRHIRGSHDAAFPIMY